MSSELGVRSPESYGVFSLLPDLGGVGAALVLLLVAGCAGAPEPVEAQARADALARAFVRFVELHYEARLASEERREPPPLIDQLRARGELRKRLREAGVEVAESDDEPLALGKEAADVRRLLVEHDYVFLPAPATDGDPGIALGHVRRRVPARTRELWGKTVAYKLVLYEPLILDWATWRARKTSTAGGVYSPGRFSRETVYIDEATLEARSKDLAAPSAGLSLEQLVDEVELRQAAYLLFAKPGVEPALVHERVLWTIARYGDADVALADLRGLAEGAGVPEPLRAAAKKVAARTEPFERLAAKEARHAALVEAARAAME